jgi:TolB-like protein
MRHLLIILLFTPLLLHGTSIRLHAEEEVRTVTAYGVTKKEAIINALLEGIQQVRGAKLEGVETLRSSLEEYYSTANGVDESFSSIESSQNEAIHKKTKGIIKSYDVISVTPGENDHGWEATVSVHVPIYKTPAISPHSRRKLAVMPFRTSKSSFVIREHSVSSQEISRQFTQKLVTELTQSRRFTVLDRDFICEYFKEKNLLLSGDTPLEEQMRLGEVLGVDYMLVGTITDVQFQRTAYQIKTLDRTDYRDKAIFIADYRIIVMPTRHVKWSDSITLTLDNKDLRKLTQSSEQQEIQQAVIQKAAQIITHKMLANIYPIRVAEIQPDGYVIFNQGGVTVSDGELFDIFKPGKKVIDPYSGESLGAVETWAATAKIEKVLDKMSYARIIKGEPGMVQKSYICRRVSAHKDTNNNNSPTQKKQKKLVPHW